MQKHTNLYLTKCGYTDTCFIPSEISGVKAVDTHHIISRGKGGEDRIENLMALTRKEHDMYGDKKHYMVFLLNAHRDFLRTKGISFDNDWFEDKIEHYNTTNI